MPENQRSWNGSGDVSREIEFDIAPLVGYLCNSAYRNGENIGKTHYASTLIVVLMFALLLFVGGYAFANATRRRYMYL